MAVQHQEYQVYFTDDNTTGGSHLADTEIGTPDDNFGDLIDLNPYGTGCNVIGINTTYAPFGTEVAMFNSGPDDVTIKHQSGSVSAAAYAITLTAGVDFVLPAGNLIWGINIPGHGWVFDNAGQ